MIFDAVSLSKGWCFTYRRQPYIGSFYMEKGSPCNISHGTSNLLSGMNDIYTKSINCITSDIIPIDTGDQYLSFMVVDEEATDHDDQPWYFLVRYLTQWHLFDPPLTYLFWTSRKICWVFKSSSALFFLNYTYQEENFKTFNTNCSNISMLYDNHLKFVLGFFEPFEDHFN